MKKTIWTVIVVAALVGVVWMGWKVLSGNLGTTDGESTLPISTEYATDVPLRVVQEVAADLGPVTRVEITPDDKLMFVTTLTGKVWVFENQNGQFVKQAEPLYEMSLGWRAGAENGLTGLIVSADWISNKQIFLLYAKSGNGRTGENQILKLKVGKPADKYVATNSTVIFTSNSAAGGAHQIQGGFGVRVEGKPHIVFAIGDNYRPAEARDLKKEAGKIMMVQEDGANPMGARPFPQYPKVQVLGIRNVYDLARNPENDWVFWTENGPDVNDRVVYAPIFDADKQFDGNWNGKGDSLAKIVVNDESKPEYVIKLWPTTVAPTDIITDELGRFYVNIFSSHAGSAKEMLMGEKVGDEWKMTQVITRKSEATGGNLLGLAMSVRGDFYFGDFVDGKLYRMTKVWSK